jgi:hypothetical protein
MKYDIGKVIKRARYTAMSRVKVTQEDSTLVLRAYGKRLYTRYANGFETHENVTLTPTLKKELDEVILNIYEERIDELRAR